MIRKFIVIDSDDESFKNKSFEIFFLLKSNVSVPFSDIEYRCNMFDGVKVRLENKEKYIIGVLN